MGTDGEGHLSWGTVADWLERLTCIGKSTGLSLARGGVGV